MEMTVSNSQIEPLLRFLRECNFGFKLSCHYAYRILEGQKERDHWEDQDVGG
jgi:hypothetical protein